MALGDEQIDRLTNNFQRIVDNASGMLDEKIDRIESLINRIKITNLNTTTFDTPEVEKAKPV